MVKHTAADFTIRRLSVFGLGKLGLPLAVLFAHRGLHTTAIDVDAALVEQLRVGKMPALEPGLDALMAGATSRLNYTTDARAAADTDASIIMVSTPYEDSRAALSGAWVEEACNADAGARAAALYGRIVEQQTPARFLSTRDAELVKIALNAFLCLKISFGNFLAQLGDRLGGADLDGVAGALALDPRVGSGLLRGGTPYGGPCLPRDIASLLHLSQSLGLDAPLAQASSDVNTAHYEFIERQVVACRPRRVAVLGLSFKPGTAVTVASPAFEFVRRLQARAIEVAVFDPIAAAREAARAHFGPTITCCDTLDESLRRADVILVCNPDPDFVAIAACLPADRHIVDPWGCVRGPHPGLKRPGRLPLREAAADASQLIHMPSAVR